MMDYMIKAGAAWLMGLFPYFEIYVAVPGAMALGLDPVSSVIWAGLGNFTAVPLIVFIHKKLSHWPRVAKWLEKSSQSKYHRMVEKYGSFFIFLCSPLAGIWVVAGLASTLGLRDYRLFMVSAASILFYGVLIATLANAGLRTLY